MYNILISGYYGFNNIGDESILRTVIDNLREKLPDVDITVLSQSPAQTSEKYGVKAAKRMSLWSIFRSVRRCDMLLSGGGSLLQDATSGRSILYYLFILRLAQLLGKRTFIYSQGIGPISAPRNRRLAAFVLRRTDGIVVRDAGSRDLLLEIGVPEALIHVTADPVIRVKKPDPALGLEILAREGCPKVPGRLTVGWAVKARRLQARHALLHVPSGQGHIAHGLRRLGGRFCGGGAHLPGRRLHQFVFLLGGPCCHRRAVHGLLKFRIGGQGGGGHTCRCRGDPGQRRGGHLAHLLGGVAQGVQILFCRRTGRCAWPAGRSSSGR